MYPIAIDLGTSRVKVASRGLIFSFPSAYLPGEIWIPSLVPRDADAELVLEGEATLGEIVRARRGKFPIKQGRIRDRQGIRFLVEGALAYFHYKGGFRDKLILARLGIGATLEMAKASKRLNFLTKFAGHRKIKYRVADEHLEAKYSIESVECWPSTLGTFWWMEGVYGQPDCILLDIGHGSTTLLAVEGRDIIFASTFPLSVEEVLAEIARDLGISARSETLFRAIERGQILLRGKIKKLGRRSKRAIKSVASELASWVEEVIDLNLPEDSLSPALFYYTGGGSILLASYLPFPGILVSEPIYSNVLGLLRKIEGK